jgi:hypothetical protein
MSDHDRKLLLAFVHYCRRCGRRLNDDGRCISCPDGIDALEAMVEKLRAENARLRAEVEKIKADDPTWFARMDRLEADLARVTGERDRLLAAARGAVCGPTECGECALINVKKIDALRAAVAACEVRT